MNGIATERVEPGVALVWLDRPTRGNAFTWPMQAELHAVLASLDADETVRAIVVTGRGKSFSTGADLEGGFAHTDAEVDELRKTVGRRERPWRLRTPVLAALNGAAIGLGLTITLQWDIRYAAQDATYGFPFVRRGVTPEMASSWTLPRLIGAARAAELLLTGRLVDGRELVDLGVAARCAPAEEVLPLALATARQIAEECSPLAVGLTKQLLQEAAQTPDLEQAWSREWELFRWLARQGDAAEGVAAFLDKRPPSFSTSKHVAPPDPLVEPWTAPS